MVRPLAAALLLFWLATPAAAQQTVVEPPKRTRTLERLAEQVEPGRVGRVERLSHYVDFFRLQLGNDTRLFAFDVTATATDEGRVALQGFVEFPETRAALAKFLEALGFDDVDNQLETLPAASLGERRFGFVKTTHSLSYDRPTEPRTVVTDCLLGEPLYLLREVDDHLLVHSGEGYVGYVAAADVHRVDAAGFASYPGNCVVRIVADQRLGSGLILPAGAQLRRVSGRGNVVRCALPTGEVVDVPRVACELAIQPTEQIERAIVSGRQLLGTPYRWGGKTSAGVDCSGLVQVAFATTGVHLPRDASQQLLLGRLTATRWYRAGLRRGDTLYFLGSLGKIRHTALYLGNDRYVQAEVPQVVISSFNPEHDNYDAKRDASFAFGKRLLQ